MSRLYGKPPINLGLVDLSPTEMMFWHDCPIKLNGSDRVVLPPNLEQFLPIVQACRLYCDPAKWLESYVYICAKTLWVTQDKPGNRPGWHSDGFMTDDLNYVWSDRNGTLFWTPDELVSFTQDHTTSLMEMEAACEEGPHTTYPNKNLLLLDQSVMHRVADILTPGMRCFVKVSVSRYKYNRVGNSINHGLHTGWDYVPRSETRNAPAPEAV